jgi:hypothetical protein
VEANKYLRTFHVAVSSFRNAHSLDIACFIIFEPPEDRGIRSARSCGELACAKPFVPPWLAVSLALTDDKLLTWDTLGIGHNAHVSFQFECPFAFIPLLSIV